MADTSIDIGFTVATDELDAGLAQAKQQLDATCAGIQLGLEGISNDAHKIAPSFEDLAKSIADMSAPAAAQKKAVEDDFAAQASQIQMLKSLHEISADEATVQEKQLEDAKLERLRDDLAHEYEANDETLAAYNKMLNGMEAAKAAHDAKIRALDQKAVAEAQQSWRSIVAPIGSAFQSSLNGIIEGNETLRQAVAKVGQSIVSDFTNMAVKRATDWIVSELTMTSASEAGNAARLASQNTAAAEGKAASAAAGSVSVFGDANKAAAGAYSATAEIPIVGPILAPAAAVAAFTAVMAYDVFSAEGGFDIPAGLNPMTQLHEREMVLPASIAEPLRAGLASGGQSGGDIHIHAVDAASFQRLLSNNKSALAKALRGAHRGFDPALV
jgi:hypothetical protein